MVFSVNDAKHLEAMYELSNKKAPEIDAKKLVENALESKTSSSQLTVNILNLCDSLRSEGFETYADALESKLVLFKIADTHLYRVHDEDGEDIINFAHPDGDHKIEDAKDHNGDVETILSQHKKIVDVMYKQPTGKLASAKNILNMVKVVLGQTQPVKKKLTTEEIIANNLNYANQTFSKIKTVVSDSGDYSLILPGQITMAINAFQSSIDKAISNSRPQNLNYLKSSFNILKGVLQPKLIGGLEKDTWNKIVNIKANNLQLIEDAINRAIFIRVGHPQSGIDASKEGHELANQVGDIPDMLFMPETSDDTETVKPDISSQFANSITSLLLTEDSYNKTLESFKQNADVKANSVAIKWLSDQQAKFEDAKKQINAAKTDNDLENVKVIINKLIQESNDFKKEWID